MRRIWSELGVTACLFLVALFLLRESFLLPPPRFEPMGPAFFPKSLLTGILILCAWNLGLGVLRLCRDRTAPADDKTGDAPAETVRDWRSVAVALFFSGYVALVVLTDIPFLLLAVLFSAFLGFMLSDWNRRALPGIVLTSLGVAGFIYVVFGLLLQSFFP